MSDSKGERQNIVVRGFEEFVSRVLQVPKKAVDRLKARQKRVTGKGRRNGKPPLVLLLVLLGLVFPGQVLSGPTNTTLIVPGKSVGSIHLGMSKDAVKAGWGAPEKVIPGVGDRYQYERFETTIQFGLDDKVARIRTWHPAMQTKEDLRVGSRRSAVYRFFGDPQEKRVTSPGLDAVRETGLYPQPGLEHFLNYEEFYHTTGINFIYHQKVRYTSSNPYLPIDPEPLVAFITVEQPR